MTDENWKRRTLADLQTIFRELFLDDNLNISEQTSPADIDEWDSMAQVSLLTAVESKFGVHFTAEDMGHISDVATLLAVLKARGAQ